MTFFGGGYQFNEFACYMLFSIPITGAITKDDESPRMVLYQRTKTKVGDWS